MRRSISGNAERRDTPVAYKQAYDAFSGMPFDEAYGLLSDARQLLETKFILGMDEAGLKSHEMSALLSEAERFDRVYQAAQISREVHDSYKSLAEPKSEKE